MVMNMDRGRGEKRELKKMDRMHQHDRMEESDMGKWEVKKI